MDAESQKDRVSTPLVRTDQVTIRKLLLMMFSNWYWFGFALLITLSLAYLFNRYKIPTYEVSALILIEEGDQTPAADLLEGFAARPGAQNLDNQILILSSYTLVRKVIEELPFDIDVYRKGFMSKVSYYPMSPIRIIAGEEGMPINTEFAFQYLGNNQFHLYASSSEGVEIDNRYAFGERVQLSEGSFVVLPQPELSDIYNGGEQIYFKYYAKDHLAKLYQKRIKVENASRDGTIVRVSVHGTNRTKNTVFLDKLTEAFINNNLEKKNQEAKRIIEFINSQLSSVSDSLMITETQLQEFRSRNRIMDISAQATQLIDQAVVLENEQARLTLERNYYTYLDEYLSEDNNSEAPIAPASMGIDDPLLANLMQELAGLQAEYFSSGVGERNPLQGQLEMRIRNTKRSIKETLSGIIQANQMAIAENQDQINRLNYQASSLPVKERQLLGIERKFNLNNVLYTFLLQRRAEAQIQKASNAPDHELIDPAMPGGIPISPNKRMIYLFAFALGIGIPTLLLLLLDLVRNKISSEEDLRMITSLPVVGYIPRTRFTDKAQMLKNPDSITAEAFRSLRTRMDFITRDVQNPVILISSTGAGEGKTFSAINLASSYSLMGKKTILVGFDLRRPTMYKTFKGSRKTGLSSLLIGKSSLDGIIFSTRSKNLDFIPSGPLPPNPGELTNSALLNDLFRNLRERYDYIIVDSAPIGTVADSYPVAVIADATVVMVRHGHTRKAHLSATLNEMHSNGVRGICLLMNDLSLSGSSYRYSSNYKYDYRVKKRSVMQRITGLPASMISRSKSANKH